MMRSPKRFFLWAIGGVLLCLFVQTEFLSFAQTQEAPPKIIENPENPKYSGEDAPELVFHHELAIPLEGRRYSFDVDETGNIYVLDTRGASISIYNKSGKILTTFGKKGQGPGEFENPVYLAVSKENKVYVVDRTRRTIQVFNSRGTSIEQKQPSSIGIMASLTFDSSGALYIQDSLNLMRLEDKERKELASRGAIALSRLAKYDRGFEKIMDIETWGNHFMKRVSGEGFVPVLYHDVFHYQIDRNNSLYTGASSQYEIHQMSSAGRLEKIIRKKAKRISTTEKDRARILEDFPELKDAALAETKPFFLDFHVLDKIGLLVGTHEDEWNDDGVLICDLFDPDGVYIAKVKVPRYYTRDHDIMNEQRNRLFKNGCCYSIVYNQKTDSLELVRHSFELK